MLLRFNKEKDVWELAKVMKLKAELNIEVEDSIPRDAIEEIKKQEHLDSDEALVDYFKKQFPIGLNEYMARQLGWDKVSVKEVFNIRMEEENAD